MSVTAGEHSVYAPKSSDLLSVITHACVFMGTFVIVRQ